MRDIDRGETTFVPTPPAPEAPQDSPTIDTTLPSALRPNNSESRFHGFQSGVVFISPRPHTTEAHSTEIDQKIEHISRHDN